MDTLAKARPRLDTLRRVELAEGVELALPAAGVFLRSIALILDLLFLSIALFLLSLLFSLASIPFHLAGAGDGILGGLMLIAIFVLSWGYFIYFESRPRGATLGKRIMGLRVVQNSGERITLQQAIVRSFLLQAEIMVGFGLLGLATALLSPRFQRLGDLAAETVVIYKQKKSDLILVRNQPPPLLNPEALPIRLTPDERQNLISFAERLNTWNLERRLELTAAASQLAGQPVDEAALQRLLRYATWLRDH